jgi:hypothetical protein
MLGHLRETYNQLEKIGPTLAASPKRYSLRDKWWIANVMAGHNKPVALDALYNDGKGYIQGIGHLDKGDAVLLPMNSGNSGLFRVQHSESYSDFGGACYSARVKYMGLYWKPSASPR